MSTVMLQWNLVKQLCGRNPAYAEIKTTSSNGENDPRPVPTPKRQLTLARQIGVALVGLALFGPAPARAEPVCRPTLTLKEVKFSEMHAPNLERRWDVTVATDASRCATKTGQFELGFLREIENGPPLEFWERFVWSTPSVTVGVGFYANEAVGRYWIDRVDACPCADERSPTAAVMPPR